MNEAGSSSVERVAAEGADTIEAAPRAPRARLAVAFAVTLLGALALEWRFGDSLEVVASWVLLGAVAGAVAGRVHLAWVVLPAAVLLYPAGVELGIGAALGRWWFLQAALAALALFGGFTLGATLAPGRTPWGVARRSWATARMRQRIGVVAAIVASVLVVGGYLGYVAVVGSEMFTRPERDANCTTPAAPRYGWRYEAINYDIADDARLAAANPDPTKCSSQGAEAGTAVVSPDGIRLAGWYIPAGNGIPPTGPTIVLVHGWHGNKSGMLRYAAPLHERFNLVLLDLRDSGRSSPTDVTMGVREQTDLEAILDWLVGNKHPAWIGALGNSMGGATVLAAAARDQRIRAVLLESTHASLITSGGNIAENEHGYPAQPTGWAISAGASWRIGQDVTAIDPERTIGELGDRPVLLIHGTADDVDYPSTSAELNLRAALRAGVPASLVYCPGGAHGMSVDACPAVWSSAANAFFGEAAGG